MNFIKMQSLGNDFVILENQEKPKNISKICDRNFGIGCDQIMITNISEDLIDVQIFNKDGSSADMCGNGIRCVAGRYFDLNPKKDSILINILPKKQKFLAEKMDKGLIKIEFAEPIIDNDFINVGNLHKIINVGSTDKSDVLDFIISKISKEDYIPYQDYNKNYISIKNSILYIVTIERGVGKTLACGSGAVASSVYVMKNDLISLNKIRIINHGSLIDESEFYAEYDSVKNKAFLIGEYRHVFSGNI